MGDRAPRGYESALLRNSVSCPWHAVHMTRVGVATSSDLAYFSEREHVSASEIQAILRRGRILVAQNPGESTPVGWLRWGLFWDEVPFMNRLHVVDGHRHGGIGQLLVTEWESQCREEGHALVMTSTLSNESAQHFYRRIGYHDAGCLLLPDEALEILFAKKVA